MSKTIIRLTLVAYFVCCSSPSRAVTFHNDPSDTTVWHSFSVVADWEINSMRASWTIPRGPLAEHNQAISLWDGLGSHDGSYILQPVVQWVKDSAGRRRWEASCWSVKRSANGSQMVNKTHPIPVNVGTEVTGVIKLTSAHDGIYIYKCFFMGMPGTELPYVASEPLDSAWVDYETRRVRSCSDYLDGLVRFDNIEVLANNKPLSKRWYTNLNKAIKDPLACGMQLDILRDSQADGAIELGIPSKQGRR